jgi:hypothetical protein
MAELADRMPALDISTKQLQMWGERWLSDTNPETKKSKKPQAFDKQQSVNFASFIDMAFGQALASMLGGIPVVAPAPGSLLPPEPDCVEVGSTRVIGGIRPQNFDAAYRPDGPRVVFDSKTLNERESVGKNWQNMINDLGTEAATVHTRFPYAIVSFIVVIPRPALASRQERDIIRTLERLGTRKDELDQNHLAEAIALIVWDPLTGAIDTDTPNINSPIRIETFADKIYPQYLDRYRGLPPHE